MLSARLSKDAFASGQTHRYDALAAAGRNKDLSV